jgi:hypothetical protein
MLVQQNNELIFNDTCHYFVSKSVIESFVSMKRNRIAAGKFNGESLQWFVIEVKGQSEIRSKGD